MSKPLLDSFSQVSTHIRCGNCFVTIGRISWKQCKICKQFNLCYDCEKIPYDKLESSTRQEHLRIHENIKNNELITNDLFQVVAYTKELDDLDINDEKFISIMEKNLILNDYDMSIVTGKLKEMENRTLTDSDQDVKQRLYAMVVDYHMRSHDKKIRILSLDGGGIRGYMPIKVLQQLILDEYLPDIENFDQNNTEHRERFLQAQREFTKQFDYFAGTSTGGLISFCLAVGYDMISVRDIYANGSYYFERNLLGPLLRPKYDPTRIHNKIEEIIGTLTLKNGKKLSAKDATLLDIHNFLNPEQAVDDDTLKTSSVRHGNLVEFIDENDPKFNEHDKFYSLKREKTLLIPSFNATKNMITVFNTSFDKHWSYRIADVLKATMAAPTYFPPQKIPRGFVENNRFIPHKDSEEIYIDGGVFANDPELVALWAVRMSWKKLLNYYIFALGTGDYNTPISSSNAGGVFAWLTNGGLIVNTLMDATRSLTEVISSNLAKFSNMKRFKFNYKLRDAMSLDDLSFVQKFDHEWETLKNRHDYQSLLYFYEKYIVDKKN